MTQKKKRWFGKILLNCWSHGMDEFLGINEHQKPSVKPATKSSGNIGVLRGPPDLWWVLSNTFCKLFFSSNLVSYQLHESAVPSVGTFWYLKDDLAGTRFAITCSLGML